MTVYELQSRIDYLINNGHLTYDDEVIIVGNKGKKTEFIECKVCFPKMNLDIENSIGDKGFYGLSFIGKLEHLEE